MTQSYKKEKTMTLNQNLETPKPIFISNAYTTYTSTLEWAIKEFQGFKATLFVHIEIQNL